MEGLNEKFPVEFRCWVGELLRLHMWGAVGYPLGDLDLSYEDWQGLVTVKVWFQEQEREAGKTGG
jgi:hypothetical protein